MDQLFELQSWVCQVLDFLFEGVSGLGFGVSETGALACPDPDVKFPQAPARRTQSLQPKLLVREFFTWKFM